MIYTITSTGDEKEFVLKNEYEEPCTTIKQKLRDTIWEAFVNGVDSFYVNCEYGIPLWAAEIICALKKYNNIYLHIVVPYEEQCKDWSEDLRNRYYSVHQKADTVEFVDQQYYSDCYDIADELMAEESDFVCVFGKKYIKTHIFTCVPVSNIKWFSI